MNVQQQLEDKRQNLELFLPQSSQWFSTFDFLIDYLTVSKLLYCQSIYW